MAGVFLPKDFTRFEHVVTGIIYLIVAILGVVGNGLLFWLFKQEGLIRSPRNIVVLNLAVANIGVVIGSPLPALSSFAEHWIFGDFGCQFYAFIGFLFGLAAIGFVFALTVERYLANCWTEIYVQMTGKHFRILSALIWGHALYWSVMPLMGWSRYKLEPTKTACTIDWMATDSNHISYVIAVTIFSYLIPIMMIVFFYLLSWMAMEERHVCDKENQVTEKQLMKVTIMLFLCSMVAWTPYAVTVMWQILTSSTEVSMFVATIAPMTAKTVTTAMPLVFLAVCPKLRESLLPMINSRAKTN
ncbi:visual pigment-like receptor peropsin [Tubulanus polymorphus]|uniref:visual pigment-like receptor peropsin n=1 Tax=Tubulanus polymorphus TaxID=672921 RepID=UPI003DA1FE1E